MTPVTLLAGPVFTYNFIDVSAPVFAAWAGFLLARELTNNLAASLIGGYLFGFSAYESGQVLGHPNLNIIALVPLMVLLCVRRQKSTISERSFILGLAAALIFELPISIEVFATACVAAALSWAIFLICAPMQERAAWWRLAGEIILASVLTVLTASAFLVYLVNGLATLQPVLNARFFAKPLNFILPTPATWLLHNRYGDISAHFDGNLAEQGAYLGAPLLAIMGLFLVSQTQKPYMRALFVTVLAIAVLSLGPTLHLPGKPTPVPMPWAILLHLPLISLALPVRFSLYVALGSSMLVSLWLNTGRKWKPLKYALAFAACIALIPDRLAHSWTLLPADPFFTADSFEKTLGLEKNVLILTFAYSGPDMFWQVASGMRFIQTAGYTGFAPKLETGWRIQDDFGAGTPGLDFNNEIQSYCDVHHVDYVLLGPGTKTSIRTAFARLGWPPLRTVFDVTIYPVPPPARMHYRYLAGDYWQTDSWIGQKVILYTRNEPLSVILSEGSGPIRKVRLVVTGLNAPRIYNFTDRSPQRIPIPANGKITLSTKDFFIADPLFHNGDRRPIALQIQF